MCAVMRTLDHFAAVLREAAAPFDGFDALERRHGVRGNRAAASQRGLHMGTAYPPFVDAMAAAVAVRAGEQFADLGAGLGSVVLQIADGDHMRALELIQDPEKLQTHPEILRLYGSG